MRSCEDLLGKLPYYATRPPAGQSIVVLPYMAGGEFLCPFYHPRRKEWLILKPETLIRGIYISKESPDPSKDVHLPLLDFVVRRFPLHRPLRFAKEAAREVCNFGAVIEKYDLILQACQSKRARGCDRLIATELEYLFYNVRSLYDRLHLIAKSVWKETRLFDTSVKKKELPKSFRGVVWKSNRLRTAEEITQTYGLPAAISGFYAKQGPFFKSCKDVRDHVAHGWGQPISDEPIYQLDRGFAVDVTNRPFCQFTCWSPDALANERLGSVRALIAHIAAQVIEATTAFVLAEESCVEFPDPMESGWRVLLRDPHVPDLLRLSEYVNHPWTG